ncbi:MAG TPA: lipid-binding SYLF domain-containing protein [Candidatus Methylacidiphilales bacterium]|jgi:lipid-binding SYLF domain-containing protein|nr:lipid-binding SYLF domain-containing protein [Candidatus Methylacidiphilales bacterium]
MKLLLATSLSLLLASTLFVRAADMDERIHNAIKIVEKRQGSTDPIPVEILQNAKAIAICTILKGGIGIGGQGGEGIILIRHMGGAGPVWRAPSAFNISGASLGAQLGFSSISYIIVLNSERAIGQFVGEGKVKWDATATGTVAGDTGVESESTRDLEKHDVLVYRDSGGLFGGATFGGSSIEVKDEINQDAYGEHVHVRDILEGKVPVPQSGQRLYDLLDGKQ